MNIGPTQQSIEANYVYQRDAIVRANQSSGSGSGEFEYYVFIDLFIFLGTLMTVGMSLKEYINFDIKWQVWGFWIIEIITFFITFCFLNWYRLVVVFGIVGTVLYAVYSYFFY